MALESSRNSAECESKQRGLRSRCRNVLSASAESVALCSGRQGESRTNKRPAANQPHHGNYAALKPPPRHFDDSAWPLGIEQIQYWRTPRPAAILGLFLSIGDKSPLHSQLRNQQLTHQVRQQAGTI